METVEIICWDGVKYSRQASEKEITEAHDLGVLKETPDGKVFDYH